MASFADYKNDYQRIWSTLVIRPDKLPDVRRKAERLLAGKAIYQNVESRTGVPWWFVGLCHYRESEFNFETYLGNGQSLSRQTTIVPKGRGPFTGPDAFLDGAIDALRLEGFIGSKDWSIERVLFRLEGFNGYGYHAKQVASPYLWGGSTAYGPPQAPGGKYIRDHVFDPATIDTQLGTAVILKQLMELDNTIALAAPQPSGQPRDPDEEMADSTLWVQQALNRLGMNTLLVEDGINGPKIMTAVSAFQQRNGLEDTGLADAPTIAAIQRALLASGSSASDVLLATRLDSLERQLATAKAQTDGSQVVKATVPPKPAETLPELEALLAALQHSIAGLANQQAAGGASSDTLQKLTEVLKTVQTAGPVLGQVNGALGNTIGQLLDGKKTAIGIIGAASTQILSQVPASTGLGQVLSLMTPASGLSPYTIPLFLAMAAWGVLGKMEKWNGASPLPQKT